MFLALIKDYILKIDVVKIYILLIEKFCYIDNSNKTFSFY